MSQGPSGSDPILRRLASWLWETPSPSPKRKAHRSRSRERQSSGRPSFASQVNELMQDSSDSHQGQGDWVRADVAGSGSVGSPLAGADVDVGRARGASQWHRTNSVLECSGGSQPGPPGRSQPGMETGGKDRQQTRHQKGSATDKGEPTERAKTLLLNAIYV